MPLFLLLQWVLELYTDESETTGWLDWVVPIVAIALFAFLAPLYHNVVSSRFAVLLPVTFITTAGTLVKFHQTVPACVVMTGGLSAMAGRVGVARYYATRGRRVFEQEWIMNHEGLKWW
jgi:hypothetical protein